MISLKYFVWYLCLIPLVLPRLKISLKSSLFYILAWFIGQVNRIFFLLNLIISIIMFLILIFFYLKIKKAVWLYFAYELEFNGNNTFIELWIAGLLFISINCYLIKSCFLDNYDFSETFSKKLNKTKTNTNSKIKIK